ncbi:MAG: TolC family protein [Bryobacterales bacterium]|nr:TolC family protein [Bryobacterales bacterium]
MWNLFVSLVMTACMLPALTLREAMAQAEKLSPTVQLANLRVLEAEAATRNARSGYQPQVAMAVNGTYQTINLQNIGLIIPGMDSRVGPFRTFDARPTLSQNLIDLSLLSRIRAARSQEAALRYDVQTAREATLLAVLQLYLQIQQADSRISAAEARRKTAEAVLRQAEQFEQAGTASKLDVARAAQQFHSEQAVLALAKGEREALAAMLLRTIGLPQQQVTLEAPAFELREVATGAADRPEVRALQARLQAAEDDRRRAERERMPRLAFVGNYGLAGTGPDRSLSTYAVGAALTIPLWTGGRIEAEIQAAKARVEQVKTQRRELDLQIAQEMKQAEIEANAALLALRASQDAVASAKQSLELARLRFSSGIATNLDTITAQGTLAQAEDVQIRTRYEFLLARARWARAVGNVYAFFD